MPDIAGSDAPRHPARSPTHAPTRHGAPTTVIMTCIGVVGAAHTTAHAQPPAGSGNGPGWRAWAAVGIVALVAGRWLYRRIRRTIRRRAPARLNPKLAKYGDQTDTLGQVARRRRAEAERIIATSSTSDIAGYEITEQVEAVFVDGFHRPEAALEGLKAVAAMKGANAVTNVHHGRDPAGGCTAQGDAVVVRRIDAPADAPHERPRRSDQHGSNRAERAQ
ncbi:MAG: hypothetical protein ACE5E6_04400 [Phycisphaerae bacterium]